MNAHAQFPVRGELWSVCQADSDPASGRRGQPDGDLHDRLHRGAQDLAEAQQVCHSCNLILTLWVGLKADSHTV